MTWFKIVSHYPAIWRDKRLQGRLLLRSGSDYSADGILGIVRCAGKDGLWASVTLESKVAIAVLVMVLCFITSSVFTGSR